MGGSSYTYAGDGSRISQQVGVDVTRYLLDLQPRLATVIGETVGANTTRYIHAPRGIHAMEDAAGVWTHPLQDGLGSVRGLADNALTVSQAINYSPYGVPDAPITGFAFTGEWRDGTGVQYHRARYVNPALGTFLSLDPFEGVWAEPMSINGYSYVHGNPVMWADASGEVIPLIFAALVVASVVGAAGWELFVNQGRGVGGANQYASAECIDWVEVIRAGAEVLGGWASAAATTPLGGVLGGVARGLRLPTLEITRPTFQGVGQAVREVFSNETFLQGITAVTGVSADSIEQVQEEEQEEEENKVTLYRAVFDPELAVITSTGLYEVFSDSVKYFTFTQADVHNFAVQTLNQGYYIQRGIDHMTLTQTAAPERLTLPPHARRFFDVGGAGNSVEIFPETIPQLFATMDPILIIGTVTRN